MQITNHIGNSQRYIREHWPAFVLGYGGGCVTILVILWLSLSQGWYSFIIIALALLALLAYLFLASIWANGYAYDIKLLRETLFTLGMVQPTDNLVHICLGRRHIPITLSRRLTTGHITVLDTYNPQLTPSRPLARARQQAQFMTDPRLSWRDGSTDLLPLPDAGTKIVTIIYAASEYSQQGDQEQLFSEIFRILSPNGQLLIAENVRSPTSILTGGISGLRNQSVKYWETLIGDAGFQLSNKTIIKDLVICWRFDKPNPYESKPLIFDK